MYRVRQFFGALTARTDEQTEQTLTSVLTPAQQRLFRRMPTSDQRHSLNVCRTLRQAGHTECTPEGKALLAAALLHDVGKAQGRIWLWQRVVIVLLERWAPRVLDWLSSGKPQRWRQGFVVHRQHPEVSAQWAEQTGCSPLTVTLIRGHQEPLGETLTDENRLLAALQRADGMN